MRSPRRLTSFAGAIVLVVVPACSQEPVAARRDEPASASREEEPNGAALKEFREMPAEGDVEIAVLLSQVAAHPQDLDRRMQISDLYAAKGYIAASRFFSNSARLLRGETIQTAPIETRIAWSAERDLATGEISALRNEISQQAGRGEFADAVETAAAAVRTHGPAPSLLAEWAAAYLQESLLRGRAGEPREFEAAVRVLLTGLGDRYPLSQSTITKAGGYSWLSNVFARFGDRPSSMTAAILALESDKTTEPALFRLSAPSRSALCQRIERLAAELDLAEETVALKPVIGECMRFRHE